MTKGLTASRRRTVFSPALKHIASKRPHSAYIKATSPCTKGPALICNDIKDLLQEEGQIYRALLVKRPQSRCYIQQHVDHLAISGAFGVEQSVNDELTIPLGKAKTYFAVSLSKKAQRLASIAVENGLPKEVGCRIQQDFEQIGTMLTKLVPSARKVLFGLVLVGENSCHKWHRDHDICRALVSYNLSGTKYVDHDHVNVRQLGLAGVDNKALVPDESRALSAAPGDILVMKGTKFPSIPNGLVHRSPENSWHADGSVRHRLLLRVALN